MLPVEVEEITKNVSVEKKNEVQTVLNQVFDGVSKMREQLDTVNVVDPEDKVNMKLANTIRLGVRQVRLNAEKTFDKKREEVQQQMLSYKTEDQLWMKAKQTMQILTKEIEEQARWKEETKQRYESEQRELKVQQRMISVSKFAPEMTRSEFEHMSDEGFSVFLSGIEKQYMDRVEAERKAEEDRLEIERKYVLYFERTKLVSPYSEFSANIVDINGADWGDLSESDFDSILNALKQAKSDHDVEQARIKAENERLKKEAEEKEAKRKSEIEAQEKKSKEESRLRAIEEAKKQAELDKIKAELEDERKRKEEAEKEEKSRIESELKKGDFDKVKDLINDLTLLKSKYQFKSQKNVKMYFDVGKLLDKVVAHIQQI
jgi:hypothetical protein